MALLSESFLVDIVDTCDVLDLAPRAIDIMCGEPPAGSSFSTRLVREVPLVMVNLAFRHVWHRVVGCAATKHDFTTFVHDYGSGVSCESDEDVRRLAGSAYAFALQETYARFAARPADELSSITASCEAHLQDVRRAPETLLPRLLIMKWLDRFTSASVCLPALELSARVDALCGMTLTNAYASIVMEAGIADLRTVAVPCFFGGGVGGEAHIGGRWDAIGSPAEYYKAAERLIGTTNALAVNPFTQYSLRAPGACRASVATNLWTHHEALRHVLVRDAHFARLIGGAVLVLAGDDEPEEVSPGTCGDSSSSCGDSSGSIDDDGALRHALAAFQAQQQPQQPRFLALGSSSLSHLIMLVANAPPTYAGLCIVPSCMRAMAQAGVMLHTEQRAATLRFCPSSKASTIKSALAAAPRTVRILPHPLLDHGPQTFSSSTWPKGFGIPKGLQRIGRLGRELHERLLKELLAQGFGPCGGAAEGYLVFLDFLATYTATRLVPMVLGNAGVLEYGRDAASMHAAPKKRKRTSCVLMIDSRSNPLSALSVSLALANLRRDAWAAVVVTTHAAREYYEACLRPIVTALLTVPGDTCVPGDEPEKLLHFLVPDAMVTSSNGFTRDAYNELLKSPGLWREILEMGFTEVLTVQDDGFLLRPGLEASYGGQRYGYVGAPWRQCAENAELATLANPELVGNGGFSLRNVSAVLSACLEHAGHGRSLFLDDTQPLPEDVFFANTVREYMPVCPRAPSTRFSVEQEPCLEALGVHRFWAYLSPDYVRAHCEGVLNESALSLPLMRMTL